MACNSLLRDTFAQLIILLIGHCSRWNPTVLYFFLRRICLCFTSRKVVVTFFPERKGAALVLYSVPDFFYAVPPGQGHEIKSVAKIHVSVFFP